MRGLRGLPEISVCHFSRAAGWVGGRATSPVDRGVCKLAALLFDPGWTLPDPRRVGGAFARRGWGLISARAVVACTGSPAFLHASEAAVCLARAPTLGLRALAMRLACHCGCAAGGVGGNAASLARRGVNDLAVPRAPFFGPG